MGLMSRFTGFDLLKAVSAVRVGMIMKQGSHGIEQSAAALEVIALVLAERHGYRTPLVGKVGLERRRLTLPVDRMSSQDRDRFAFALQGLVQGP
jgi:hypothetical protein